MWSYPADALFWSGLSFREICTELYWCSSSTSPLLPTSFPAPFTRHYDSLDSATNGRSDIDSGSGSSRHTSRRYSLDSRHSLSDRWVSVPPLTLLFLSSSAPACDSVSLWRQWWTCPVLLAHCACMHVLLPCCSIYNTILSRQLVTLHLYLLCSKRTIHKSVFQMMHHTHLHQYCTVCVGLYCRVMM